MEISISIARKAPKIKENLTVVFFFFFFLNVRIKTAENSDRPTYWSEKEFGEILFQSEPTSKIERIDNLGEIPTQCCRCSSMIERNGKP